MSFVWGEVRRTLFQAAVEQRQWSAVTKLGDHNLYDDQRGWALGEALRERQMNVMVVLGEHGLTNYQLRRVHRQVAKHGEWKLFLRLRDQGANVKEVRQDLETANIGRERPPSEEAIKKYNKRLQQLRELERQIFRDSKHFEVAVANRNWPAVLLRLRRKGTEDMINTALRAAVEAQAWYVVVLLVKLGLSAEQRNLLFPEAIKHQLWGLGRALLEREHGVSAHLCESFLPQLIEARQWVLVARVVEQDVDDVVRRRILQQAIDKREGSVAAHCISIIRDRMSVDERESIFKRVLAEDQWLVVRPLVEEQDSTGADQRVRAFLAAIERERWDDVDHCVHHGADIDMKDEDGHTLLQKYAREKCWSKVEGLVRLGASQSMVDKDGYLAIHRAANEREVCFKQPEALKALVEFHGDINQRDPEGYTPLHRFIQYNYTAMVECALLWGRNVGQRIAYDGKTVLHLMSENNLPDTIRFIVGRGGDPLALDSRGQTILSYACKPGYRKGRRALVECIKLGITTYQPYINLLIRLGYISTGAFSRMLSYHIAPFETAYEQKDVVAMGMLYESGACSYLEMFDLYAQPQFVMEFGKPDDFDNLSMIDQVCWREEDLLQKRKNRVSMQYLARIATNPRSLQSMCRILISLFVDVGKFKWRKEKVKRLPVLSDKMKDYVLFCDLIRPDFGKQWMCD
nr:hypothetical protein BaRGS_028372 [Batillaria attramentaria]